MPLRVGLFTESYDPVINGVSTSVKTLANELCRAGHDPMIVAPHYPDFADEKDAPLRVVRLPSWRTLFNPQNPFAYPPVGPPPRVLRNLSVDIIHTQQPFGMGHHGRLTARRLKVPLVSTFHTFYTEYTHYLPIFPPPVARWWLEDQMRRYYRACDAVIVPSREAGRRLEVVGVEGAKIHVVPTGVAEAPTVMPQAVEQTRRSLSLPAGAPVILFVGRIAREKNLDLLIDSFARLILEAGQKGVCYPILLLVGSGPYLLAARQRVEAAGIAKWVRFPGFLKRGELAPVYAAATIFAFPSATETQGVVLSEAQSYGLPCVVVDGGGAPEFVRPGVDALVVPPRVDAFHEALVDLLENEARRSAFAAAALKSPLRPTPANMAVKVMEVYERLTGRVTSPPP